MTETLALALRRVAEYLEPARDLVVDEWAKALREVSPEGETELELRASCAHRVEVLLGRMGRGEIDQTLSDARVVAGWRSAICSPPMECTWPLSPKRC